MIMDPSELRMLARHMDTPASEVFEMKLQRLHSNHSLNNSSVVFIPRFWSETVFTGLSEVIEKYPNLKFGSIIETKSRLRVYSMPSGGVIEKLMIRLYNKIDVLVLEIIDRLSKGDKKPFFMK